MELSGSAAIQALLLDICQDLRGWIEYQQELGADSAMFVNCPPLVESPARQVNAGRINPQRNPETPNAPKTSAEQPGRMPNRPPQPAQPTGNASDSGSLFAFRRLSQSNAAVASKPLSVDDRKERLGALEAAARNCTKCPLSRNRLGTLFGFGNLQPQVLFLGGGFDPEEFKQNQIFVGETGELVNKMIAAMHLRREEIYFANIIKCVPQAHQRPNAQLAYPCQDFLAQQIRLVNPRVIIAWGEAAYLSLFRNSKERITQVRGVWKNFKGYPVMPTLHPAYLLQNPKCKKLTWHDLQLVIKKLEIPRT